MGKFNLRIRSAESMPVEPRLETALEGRPYDLNPNGSKKTEVDIPSAGLTLDEVLEHDAVVDAILRDDEFHVWVSVSSQQRVFKTD